MKHWKSIGQAFENLGTKLHDTCITLGEMSEADEAYQELYSHYCLVLSTLTAQVRWLNMKFDVVRYEQEDEQGE